MGFRGAVLRNKVFYPNPDFLHFLSPFSAPWCGFGPIKACGFLCGRKPTFQSTDLGCVPRGYLRSRGQYLTPTVTENPPRASA